MARGAGLGFLTGVALGALIGYESGCSRCDGDWRPLYAIYGGFFGGLGGALVGLAFGSRYGTWETIP